MIALADLRSPAVAIDWHEAVAVAAALGELIARDGLPLAPGLEDVGLAADGTITMVQASLVGQAAAAGLAAVLDALLNAAPCPVELRQLIDEAASGRVPFETLREQLAFFERPGREATLAALAARAGPALASARAAAELDRLTERARQQASAPDGPRSERPVDGTSGPAAADPAAASVRDHARPAAVAITVFVAMAVVAATLVPFLARQSARIASPAPDQPTSVPPGEPPERPRSEDATPPPVARDGASAVPPRPAAPRPAPPAPDRTNPAKPAPAPGVDVRVNELGGIALPGVRPTPPPAPRPSSGVPAGGPIHAAGDPGVTPARLIRPHLPAEPPADVPPEQVGTLELIVDERGTVETVHLISPANRYQERMLVAAAKSWLFQPAMKNGRPVRFRARIRVTL